MRSPKNKYVQALEDQNAYYCRRMTEAYRAAEIVAGCLVLASIGLAMTMVALYAYDDVLDDPGSMRPDAFGYRGTP